MDEKRTLGAEQNRNAQSTIGTRGPNEASTGTADQAKDTLNQAAGVASETVQTAYDRSRRYARQIGEQYPQARRYYERGSRAVNYGISEAPLLSLLTVGAIGYLFAWAIHGGRSDSQEQMRRARKGDYPGHRSGKPLIESDRVEGTSVYDMDGNHIGTIRRVMIEKISGRVAYAVMSFGGFLGLGSEDYAIPWSMLDYDTELEGYRTDIKEDELKHAPGFSRDQGYDWSDPRRDRELHDYYGVTYYWLVP